jgi:hypothetical protein
MTKSKQIDTLVSEYNFTQVTENSLVCKNGPCTFEIYYNENNSIELTITFVGLNEEDDEPTFFKTYQKFNSLIEQLNICSGCETF